MPRLPRTPGQFLIVVLLALAYFLVARLLIAVSVTPAGPVTTLWLPSGISVAFLVLYGPYAVIGSFFGSIAVALATQSPPALAVAVALGNAVGELLCWWLVAGRRRDGFSIENVSDGPWLLAAAAAAGAVSASVSVSGYVHFGFIPAQAYLANWLSWMGSATASIVVVVPLLVYCMGARPRPWPEKARLPEYASALALLLLAAVVWQGPMFARGVDEPVILLLIAGQLWIAFRFAPPAMTLSNCVIAAAAVVALVLRLGHAPPASAYPFIVSLQLMLVGLPLIGYILSALVERQRRSAQALQDAQASVVTAARDAGRAEIATNVLHNVGNVLNSVNVSVQLVASRLRSSKVQGMSRAADLMDAHAHELAAFMTQDPKGKLLPAYLGQVTRAVEQEHRELGNELQVLVRNIDHIKDIVATQQNYAGVSTVVSPVALRDVVEDVLRLERHALDSAGVSVVREYDDVPVTPLDHARVMQIIVNLVSNARHAMAGCDGTRRMTVRIGRDDGSLFVSVRDEGEGIPPENRVRIFSHGFTTRKQGHGFGLHSSALAAKQMAGSLVAHSDGLGTGATFTLRLPLATQS